MAAAKLKLKKKIEKYLNCNYNNHQINDLVQKMAICVIIIIIANPQSSIHTDSSTSETINLKSAFTKYVILVQQAETISVTTRESSRTGKYIYSCCNQDQPF